MTLTRDSVYVAAYEARQRDPIIDRFNRASVANGRMNRWQRFNRASTLVYVNDYEGNPRALTPKQLSVLSLSLSMVDGRMITMRAMAAELGVSTSTVSRALAKLQSWGLLVYMVGRGRFAGLVVVRYIRDNGFLDAKRKAAKERVRRWSEAAQRRFSRLAFNVAPYILGGEEGLRTLQSTSTLTTTTKGATLTAQRSWTPDELRDLGII